jgi:tyrosyl-tRNA synthetase
MRVLVQGAADVITEADLLAKLERAQATDVPLRVKLGADPSAPDIHLGHAVPLRKLRQFQEFGHEVYFVIGDFTGRIGDPSGKSETRRQLGEAEVRANAKTYEDQIFKILLPGLTHVVFNNDWLGRLTFADVIRLAASYTVARMLERDEFAARMRDGRPIHVHEFMYPLAQAYDSVHLRADVELGGTDQTFNFVATRDVMRAYDLEPQVALTVPLLVGTDGTDKMSKSLGNYIGINDEPAEIYGRAMSVPDHLLLNYLTLTTGWGPDRVKELADQLTDGVNPRDIKMMLAHRLVELYHGLPAADGAEARFRQVFQQGALPAEMPERKIAALAAPGARIMSLRLLMDCAGDVLSSSEARRLLRQGGVRLNGVPLAEEGEVMLMDGDVLQIGKRRFFRLRVE